MIRCKDNIRHDTNIFIVMLTTFELGIQPTKRLVFWEVGRVVINFKEQIPLSMLVIVEIDKGAGGGR